MAAGSGGPRGRSDTGMAVVGTDRPGVGPPPRRLDERERQGLRCCGARTGVQRPPLPPASGKRARAARDPALALGRPRGTQARKIDLEVSEPVNYSSGDHKYLVQKAAIKGVRSNPEQPFTYSSRDTPQEAIKYPHPKNRDGANTYAVQISEDVTPDESTTGAPSPFEDMSVRRGFIMKVFIILSVQLLITMVIISIFVFCKPVRKWIIGIPWFMYALFPAVLVVIIVLACCRDIRRQVPANYILLALFTLLEGLMLGSMSIFYKAEEILWAAGATTLVTLVLTLFALQTKWDFTMLNGVMFVFLVVLMIYGIIALVVRSYWLHLVYSALGTLIFSMYLVMDVQMMVGGHYHYEIDPEEYIFAVLNIYVDIINLFIFILDLIGR
ncbi:protein lifeguard 2-like [Microtus oregoni]|uniref:protein lifeguard 2-like n=1 Tax=Microtus oregoni TaxID=111838 RepID=UPI001BB0DD21|nr:protein lifeguard 2-like [Microtus oregoni]